MVTQSSSYNFRCKVGAARGNADSQALEQLGRWIYSSSATNAHWSQQPQLQHPAHIPVSRHTPQYDHEDWSLPRVKLAVGMPHRYWIRSILSASQNLSKTHTSKRHRPVPTFSS